MEKIKKGYFEFTSGCFSIFLKERLANEMKKLMQRQKDEVINLLLQNIDEVEIFNLVMAYGEDEIRRDVYYIEPTTKEKKKEYVKKYENKVCIKEIPIVVFASSFYEAFDIYKNLHNSEI